MDVYAEILCPLQNDDPYVDCSHQNWSTIESASLRPGARHAPKAMDATTLIVSEFSIADMPNTTEY
eukprot:11132589-Heterocapsa_arctica.AAC.1